MAGPEPVRARPLLLLSFYLFASAALTRTVFELLARLLHLRLLLRRQDRKHLLANAEPLAHHLRFERGNLGELLAHESFIEGAAFVRLAKLLAFGAQGFVQRAQALLMALAD